MLLNMFQPNYWLFGNNPKDGSKWDKTQDVTKWGSYIEDGESITGWPKGITNYYVSTNVNNIKIGDIAFFWSFPNFAITTVGYIVSEPYSEDGSFWCDMFLLQIEEKNWIIRLVEKNDKLSKNMRLTNYITYLLLKTPSSSSVIFGGSKTCNNWRK